MPPPPREPPMLRPLSRDCPRLRACASRFMPLLPREFCQPPAPCCCHPPEPFCRITLPLGELNTLLGRAEGRPAPPTAPVEGRAPARFAAPELGRVDGRAE